MNDPTGQSALAHGLERRPVLCARCGEGWDERVVPPADEHVVDDGLCTSCLLLTQHGEQLPVPPACSSTEPCMSEPSGAVPTEVA